MEWQGRSCNGTDKKRRKYRSVYRTGGGFAPEEIEMVRDEMQLISLGRRILRTETAGIAALAILGYQLESQTDGRDE